MANVDAPRGFRPVRHLTGGEVRASEYSILTTYATKIHTGDLVVLASDGTLNRAAAADATIIGVFAGVYYETSDGTPTFSKYWPGVSDGKKNIKAMVYDDPNIVYVCQADDALALADMGLNADVNTVTDGDNTLGTSAMEIDASDKKQATAQIRMLRLWPDPNNTFAANQDIECIINEHLLRLTTGAPA